MTKPDKELEDPGVALKSFLARKTTPSPAGSSPASNASGDWIVAGLGLTLALVCALFPWYIFFNQEKFGVRALEFSGQGSTSMSTSLSAQPQRIGAPMSIEDIPIGQLDLFATASASPDDAAGALPADQQPFPADLIEYRLLHVANGRAMIEDEDGVWIVQVGSALPDNSHVRSIEKRDGKWALVTSEERIVELTP